MPEAVEKCVEDRMGDPKFKTYYNKLKKKKGKDWAKQYPDARSLAWAICQSSYQKSKEGNMDPQGYKFQVLGSIQEADPAEIDFVDKDTIEQIKGYGGVKILVSDLMMLETPSQHEGKSFWFSEKAIRPILGSLITKPVVVNNDFTGHRDEDGGFTVIGTKLGATIKKDERGKFVRTATVIWTDRYPRIIEQLEKFSDLIGESYELSIPLSGVEETKDMYKIMEATSFDGSALLRKDHAGFENTQLVLWASKDGVAMDIDQDKDKVGIKFISDKGASDMEGRALQDGSFEKVIYDIRMAASKQQIVCNHAREDYCPESVATDPNNVILHCWRDSKYWKVSYSIKDGEVSFGKPSEVKEVWVKANFKEEIALRGATLRHTRKTKRPMKGGKNMHYLELKASLCEECSPKLEGSIEAGELIPKDKVQELEIVTNANTEIDSLKNQVNTLTEERDNFKTENETLKSEKESLEKEKNDAIVAKNVTDEWEKIKANYKAEDEKKVREILDRKFKGEAKFEDGQTLEAIKIKGSDDPGISQGNSSKPGTITQEQAKKMASNVKC